MTGQMAREFESIFVEHPRILEAEQALNDLEQRRRAALVSANEHLCTDVDTAHTFNFGSAHVHAEDRDNGYTQYAMLIVGPSGSGKSRFLDHIASQERFRADLTGVDGDVLPLLRLDMPDVATPKSFLMELCQASGLTLPKQITRNELASRLRNQLREIRTVLIAIDEAHTLVEHRSEEAVIAGARTLKFLLNTCGVPIVLVGEEPLRQLAEYPALMRRLDAHISFDAYNWSDEDQRFEFLNYLDQLEEALGLANGSGLVDPDMASRLYFVSRGHIGQVVKYLSKARKLALRANKKSLNAKLLAAAYRELHPICATVLADPDLIIPAPEKTLNPFAVDRTTFKKMWALRFNGAPAEDMSAIVRRQRRSSKPKNVFGK